MVSYLMQYMIVDIWIVHKQQFILGYNLIVANIVEWNGIKKHTNTHQQSSYKIVKLFNW